MARDIEAGRAFIKLALTGRGQVEAGLKSVGQSISSIAGLASKLTATIGAVGLTAGFVSSIKAASDMQQTMGQFNDVFGDSSDAVKKWSDDLATSIGRSKQQVASFLASTQLMLTTMGFGSDQAAKMSKQITQLALDLAAFANVSDEQAFSDIEAAMTGATRGLKKYGVVLDDAQIKQELLNEALVPDKATQTEKAYATLQLILRATTAAQGDAIRANDTFEGSWKRLSAEIENAKVELGDKFLPAATTITQVLSDMAIALADVALNKDTFGDMAINAQDTADALLGLVDTLQELFRFVLLIKSAFDLVGAAVLNMISLLSYDWMAGGGAVFDEFSAKSEEVFRKAEKEFAAAMDPEKFSEQLRRSMDAAKAAREEANAAMKDAAASVSKIAGGPNTGAPGRGSFFKALSEEQIIARNRANFQPRGPTYEAAMERIDELKKIEANTRAVIPSLDAVREGTIEAAHAAEENDQNAALARQLEEERKQTAELQKITTNIRMFPLIGVLRL